jgi:hypothetical protein
VTTRETLHRILADLTDDELQEVETFAGYLKHRRDRITPRVGPGWPTAIEELRNELGADHIIVPTEPGEPWQAVYTGRSIEMVDPMLQALYSAPLDDEPVTEEDEAAVEEARQEAARGETVPLEALRRELGW